MAGLMKTMCLALLLAAAAVVISPPAEALTCGQVAGYVAQCIPYVTNRGPLGRCCGGVRGLYGAARTTADRRSVCNCLKTLARSYSINQGKAAGLPGQCGVRIPYKISPSTDCSRVR